MGGFPSVTLNAELITRWRTILESHGMTVWLDEEEEERHAGKPASRVLNVAWRVSDGIIELHVLETIVRDPGDEEFSLMFGIFGAKGRKEMKDKEQLVKAIQEILIASGATTEKRKK